MSHHPPPEMLRALDERDEYKARAEHAEKIADKFAEQRDTWIARANAAENERDALVDAAGEWWRDELKSCVSKAAGVPNDHYKARAEKAETELAALRGGTK